MVNSSALKNGLLSLALAFSVTSTWAGSYEDFFKAIKTDRVGVVESLLQRGFDPNTVNPQGIPGLILAVQEASLKTANLLISWPGTRVEVRNDRDESALMLAAIQGHLSLVQKLVEKDADVNKTGWTPLHYAAARSHLAVMAFLLENSAYIDAESPNGTTPLMMATMYGTPAAVLLLIQAGADPTVKNQLGLTALDFAQQAQRHDALALIKTSLTHWPSPQNPKPKP